MIDFSKFIQSEELKLIWDIVRTVGGWLLGIGVIKWAIIELTAPKIEISNIKKNFVSFPNNAEDKLIIQYDIKNSSLLGKYNPFPKSIQNYSHGYWFKQGSGVYKIENSKAKENFFIPYGESIQAIETIEMSFTSNTDYTMILNYQRGERVIGKKTFNIHIDTVPEKEDWVYNQKNEK